jgi:hypothetical protein
MTVRTGHYSEKRTLHDNKRGHYITVRRRHYMTIKEDIT